jgi:uncharacterized OB-fold protein
MTGKKEEYLAIRSEVRIPFKQCAGQYLTKFLLEMRDHARIIVNKCPKCGKMNLPPNIVCSFCKIRIEDKPENWVQLSDKGTVVLYHGATERGTEPLTGKPIGPDNPGAGIVLDGGDNTCRVYHILEEMDLNKIKRGMRVQAVWKPREERTGILSDIRFFEAIKK